MLTLDVKVARTDFGPGGERDKTARHNWWPIAYSDELKRSGARPLSIKLFGEPLVVFNGADGSARCLADVCPHKSVALSHGYVEGGRIVCRYHGWRFAADGQCVHPAELNGKERATLYSYPVVDDGLLLWVYPSLDVPSPFMNPVLAHAARAGIQLHGYKPRKFTFDQPWELWAASFVDGTHHEYAHPNTFLKGQRSTLTFMFDETISPASMVVCGQHDRALGALVYLTFSPVEECRHKQFLTIFPISDVLPARVSHSLFRTFRVADLLYKVVYEDYYLIVKQHERIMQGASKWGLRGRYGAPTSDRFIDWHRAREKDAVWFDSYSKAGVPLLRPERSTGAPRTGQLPVLQDSGSDLGPPAARTPGAPFEAATPRTWTGLNLSDRAVKWIAEYAIKLAPLG